MSWWRQIAESRRLRPTTVAPEGVPRAVDRLLQPWLAAAFGTDRGGEAELERLRADPNATIDAVRRSYADAAKSDELMRWALVYCAAELATPDGFEFLSSVLDEPVPSERSVDIHHFSSVAEETTIRFQAARGLAVLAAAGHDDAQRRLTAALEHPLYAVRATAAQLLRELPNRPVSDEELRRRLPARDVEEIMRLKRMPVDEVRTEVEEERAKTTTPKPPQGSSGRQLTDSEARRAPRINRSERG
jgi:hypothetical protein